MSDAPALPPPPGGDQNKAPGLLAASVFTTLLALVLVTLRFYTRIVVISNLGWDDYTIGLSMASRLFLFDRFKSLTVHRL